MKKYIMNNLGFVREVDETPMSAYELADALENDWADVFRDDAAKMLREKQDEIIKLKLEWQYMADLTEKLQDFAIWMTGCGYDFTKHEYFNKCRDELLVGLKNENTN